MKRINSLGITLVAGALLAATSGCAQEGPAETAGKKVDNVMDDAGRQVEKAGDDIQDAVRGDGK